MKARIDHSKCKSHYVCNLMAPTIVWSAKSLTIPRSHKKTLMMSNSPLHNTRHFHAPKRRLLLLSDQAEKTRPYTVLGLIRRDVVSAKSSASFVVNI